MSIDRTTLTALVAAWKPGGDERLLDMILDGAVALGDAALARPALDQIALQDATPTQLGKIARLALMAGDAPAAQDAYATALAANPTVEDPALAAEIAEALDAEASEEPAKALNVVSIADRWTSDREPPAASRMAEAAAAHESRRAPVRFEDVGGLDEVKAQIRRKIITPFQKPSLYARFRRKSGGGVLLYGPPGCGKTLLARATAGECGARFLNAHIAEILDMYVGESEKRLSALFAEARRETPCVLFFDELEALASKRGHATGETKASLVSTFLAELDGFEANNEGVLILAATNMPWAVDPAFRRPGRFDRLQFVPPPDRAARRAILEILLRDRPGAETLDADRIAADASGFSGADLENLVDSAADLAIEASLDSGEEQPLSMALMRQARAEVGATTLEWLTTARNYAKYSNEGGQYDEVAKFLKAFGK